MSSRARDVIAALVLHGGIHRLSRWLNRRRLLVLTYHGVLPRSGGGFLNRNCVSVEEFERQVAFLKRHYQLLTLEQALDGIAGRRALPPYGALITFDDGFRNNVELAGPVLRRHGAPAVLFVTTGMLDRPGTLPWVEQISAALVLTPARTLNLDFQGRERRYALHTLADRLRACEELRHELKRAPSLERERVTAAIERQCPIPPGALDPQRFDFMDWNEARAAAGSGLAIGSHTVRHLCLSTLDDAELAGEIAGSKQSIEDELGRPCVALSYPDGTPESFCARDREALRALGYQGAFTQIPGYNEVGADLFALRRFNVPGGTAGFGAFVLTLAGARRDTRLRSQGIGPPGRDPGSANIKREVGLHPGTFRSASPTARILEITSYPPPRAGWGVRVSYLRRHLLEHGHDCQVLNLGKSRKIKSPDYVDVQGMLDYLSKVVRFVGRGYMVHAHINGDGGKGWYLTLAAELICRLGGRPLVLTFHAGPLQRFFPRERSGAFAPLLWLLLRLPQRIICNDENVKRSLLTFGIPAEKIRPIPAFSRQYLEFTPAALPPALEEFAARHAPLLVVYFFLRPEFFIDSLLEAIAELARRHPRLGVVLAGGGSDQPEARERITAAAIGPQVHCAGDLDHDRFMTLLGRAHIYVRTPSKDGVCSSVLEALSLGVPVVASENGRRPQSVITFPPDDAAALVRTLDDAWARYDEVRRSVQKPLIRDTVSEEVALLLESAGHRERAPAGLTESRS